MASIEKKKQNELNADGYSRPFPAMLPSKILFATYFFITLLIINAGAIVDSFFHPEIPYFDEEHLIVGGFTGVICIILFSLIATYSQRIRQYTKDELKIRKRLEILTQHANDAILLANESGQIIEANDQAILTYGYSADQLTKMTIGELFPSEIKDKVVDRLKRIEENGGLVFDDELHFKNGTVIKVEISSKALTIDDEIFYQFIIRDITQRKQTESSLNEIREIFHHFLKNSPVCPRRRKKSRRKRRASARCARSRRPPTARGASTGAAGAATSAPAVIQDRGAAEERPGVTADRRRRAGVVRR
jgi:PAS domain S-box-containing protein